MPYAILLHPNAHKTLNKLDKPLRSRIEERLKQLREHPEAGKLLHPSNYWSIRVGDYRIIYDVNPKLKQVRVFIIGHRENVYAEFHRFL